jgi:hypothetical protein
MIKKNFINGTAGNSTCALMYNRQRPHSYYGGENLKYYLIPSLAEFLTRRAALRANYIGPQPVHGGRGLHNLLMSMVHVHVLYI